MATLQEDIEELREVCERFSRFAGDESGKGMATWFQGCAALIREITEKALTVRPDGIEIEVITDPSGLPSGGFRVGTILYIAHAPEEGRSG